MKRRRNNDILFGSRGRLGTREAWMIVHSSRQECYRDNKKIALPNQVDNAIEVRKSFAADYRLAIDVFPKSNEKSCDVPATRLNVFSLVTGWPLMSAVTSIV